MEKLCWLKNHDWLKSRSPGLWERDFQNLMALASVITLMALIEPRRNKLACKALCARNPKEEMVTKLRPTYEQRERAWSWDGGVIECPWGQQRRWRPAQNQPGVGGWNVGTGDQHPWGKQRWFVPFSVTNVFQSHKKPVSQALFYNHFAETKALKNRGNLWKFTQVVHDPKCHAFLAKMQDKRKTGG
jgi:hypothetical protein